MGNVPVWQVLRAATIHQSFAVRCIIKTIAESCMYVCFAATWRLDVEARGFVVYYYGIYKRHDVLLVTTTWYVWSWNFWWYAGVLLPCCHFPHTASRSIHSAIYGVSPATQMVWCSWAHLCLWQIHQALSAMLYFRGRPASLSSYLHYCCLHTAGRPIHCP